MMRIAIINITLGGMSGGYRVYLQRILPRLAAHADVDKILCAAPGALNVSDWFEPMDNVSFADCGTIRLLGHGPRREFAEQLADFGPDVLFVPLARRFEFGNLPVVNMVQGMEPLVYRGPDPPLEKIKNAFRRRAVADAIRHADGFIAVSQFVKNFLIEELSVPGKKIQLAHYGPVKPAEESVKPGDVPDDWAGEFIFTAGAIRPARGLEDVIHAMKHLADRNTHAKLVIAGATDRRMSPYRRRLEKYISCCGLGDNVIWTGSLDKERMSWCYRNCLAFVMTSRVESFGIIAIEAMSAGCVCIGADNPCLPEIFGQGAELYSPKNSRDLADTIERVLVADRAELDRRSNMSQKRASEFSWDLCAEKTVEQLKRTITSRQ